MKFLQKWQKQIKKMKDKVIPGSTQHFFCGIGESEIKEASIKIWNYPFEPSNIFPSKEIQADEIEEVHLDQYPPTVRVNNELIFISREKVDQLKEFAKANQLKISERASNWDYLTEPFLDTEHDAEQKAASINSLMRNGFTEMEIFEIRKEIGKQMTKYNFDTMLWEWGILGLTDVLSAMRPSLNKEKFKAFYWKAMEIEQRKQ